MPLIILVLPLHAMEEGYNKNQKDEELNDFVYLENYQEGYQKGYQSYLHSLIAAESKQEEIEGENLDKMNKNLITNLDLVCARFKDIPTCDKYGICCTLTMITSNMLEDATFDVPELNTVRNILFLRSMHQKNQWQKLITHSFNMKRKEPFLFSNDAREYLAQHLLGDHNPDENNELLVKELFQLYKDDEVIKTFLPPLEDTHEMKK